VSTLESQLQASLDIVELRKRDSATLAAVIKAAQAELAARKLKLRRDVAELAKARKVLQRQAAELSAAGIRVRARAERKDKGVKRAPSQSIRSVVMRVDEDYVSELSSFEQTLADSEYAASLQYEQERDDFERSNAPRGNEP
jgi:hypothetical protein